MSNTGVILDAVAERLRTQFPVVDVDVDGFDMDAGVDSRVAVNPVSEESEAVGLGGRRMNVLTMEIVIGTRSGIPGAASKAKIALYSDTSGALDSKLGGIVKTLSYSGWEREETEPGSRSSIINMSVSAEYHETLNDPNTLL